MARPTGRPIRSEVIAAATTLVQTSGVGALSFGAVARRVGIAAPSIHHHFHTRDDLVTAMAMDYRHGFLQRARRLSGSPVERLDAYARLFAATAADGRACLCAALATSWDDLGAATQECVTAFFEEQRAWLGAVLLDAVDAGEVRPDLDVAAVAALALDMLEGAVVAARGHPDAERGPVDAMRTLVATLRPAMVR